MTNKYFLLRIARRDLNEEVVSNDLIKINLQDAPLSQTIHFTESIHPSQNFNPKPNKDTSGAN